MSEGQTSYFSYPIDARGISGIRWLNSRAFHGLRMVW